jgi:TolB-like protein
VNIVFIYRLIRSRDGSIIGQVTKSAKGDEGSWKENREELTQPRDRAKSILADQLRSLPRDLAPWQTVESRTLEKDKGKNPRMKEAEKLVKAKNYQAALNLYREIYSSTGNFAAGYNAAIFTEALGDLNGAITLMQRLSQQSGNPGAASELARMNRTLSDSRILAEKYGESGSQTLIAAKKVSSDLNTRLSRGTKISILNITAAGRQNEKQLADYVIEQLTTEIVNARLLTVVERQNIELIRTEQAFQMSGEVSDDSAIGIGHLLGAEVVVTCSVTGTNNLRRLIVRALNVETGEILHQSSTEI